MATRRRATKPQRGPADRRKGPYINPSLKEKPSRRVRIRPGPGHYFVLSRDTELAVFDEFSGPRGAKAYLDGHADTLPSGSEVVRRVDGVVLAYLSKSGQSTQDE